MNFKQYSLPLGLGIGIGLYAQRINRRTAVYVIFMNRISKMSGMEDWKRWVDQVMKIKYNS